MRRARINVKPNFRPGSRSGLAGELTSQGAADTDSTLPTVKAEKPAMPSPSPQVNPPVEETPQALGVKNDPQSPLAKSSPNQHGGAPSSGRSTPDAVPQRRMRLSATPKLSRPRVTSVPRPAARTPSLAVPTLPSDGPGLDSTHETTALDSRNSDNLSDSGIPYSTLPTKVAMTLSTSYPPLSPCVPSTSGLQKPFVHDEKSVEDSPPSPPPGHLPQQPPQEQGAHQCSTQVSGVPSVYAKSTCFDMPGSPKETDKERILKALKLKELMKIEKRRDIERAKKSVRQKREYAALDHSKMTMRDLIYYLPNTSPMKSSMVREEDQAEVTVPPLPKVPEKTQETDEEEAESENEGMLMPKVRVAEDGSIILDEDSLTVRVQRTSDTVVVESSNPLFERGSTTSYTSFRNWNYVKSWSVRETDMFFLAISMVGTDFSLIAQLLPHRSRSEIKNKFKREERASAWRIDKAFRNKRPYDKEFFSFLLERVLAKDKEKGKSIKLVMTQSRKAGKTRGKKGKKSVCEEECHGDEEDQHFEMEDGGQVYAEKENENLSNVNETDTAPAKRKRKRPRQVNEAKDAEDLSEEQVQRKKRKRSKTTPKGISSPHDGEDESGIFNMADDAVNANKEDELGSNAPTRKKKHKTSRKGGKEGEVEKPAEGRKGSWSRKNGTLVPAHAVDVPQQKSVRVAQKPKPYLGRRGCKRSIEPETTNEPDDIQVAISPMEKGQLQKEAENVMERTPPREKNLHSPSKLHSISKESEPPGNSPASPSISESSSSKQMKMQRSDRAKRNLTFGGQKGRRKGMMDHEESEHDPASEDKESPKKQIVTQESEDSDMDNTLDEKLGDFSYLHALNSPMFQRRPLVMLSREEVDMFLSDQEQTAAKQPSPLPSPSSSPQMSPLDLSLNTELSFQLSNLMEENVEVGQDECVVGGPPDIDSQSAVLESHWEDLEMMESASESCSGVLEGSRASVVAAPQTWDRPQGSVSITTEIKENMQESLSEPAEVVERSQESVVTALEVKEGTQGSVMTTPEIKLRSEGSLVSTPVVKEDSQEDVEVATPDINERSQVLIPEINKYSQGSLREPAEVSERSQETVVPTPEIMEGFQRSQLMSTEIKEDSERSLLETCEVLERSQESVVTTLEIKEGSEDAFLATPEIKASQESRGSLLEPSEVSPMSQEFALLNPKIKQMPEGLVMTTAIIKAHSLEEEEHAIQPSSTKLSSGTSISCEHGVILKRRSRFLKPKPNLNLASRVMNCSPKQKSIEPNTTVSSEKLLLQSSAVDQLCDLDFAKENISKKKGIYLSSVHHAESKPSKVPSGASVTVLEQEQKITTVTLNEVSAPVLQMASDQTKSSCDVVMTPNCQSVADLQKTDTSRVSPLPSQTGQMTETCHVACAPAKVIHSAGDGQSNEEPTFILTLYEIPVTQADLAFASNDSAMTSDLYPVEVPSPPVSSALPSTPYCPSIFLPMKIEETEKECVGISQNELSDSLGMLTEDIGENVTLGLTTTLKRGAEFSEETPETEGSLSPEVIKVMKVDYQGMPQATHQTITHQAKDKYKEGSAKQEAEDISVKSSPQDTEKCEGISHVVLADVLMPVSEDYVSKESAMPEEINIHREGCSSAVHAKTQEIPSEELKKVKHPTAVSSPLFSIMEDSKCKQSLSEEKKAPAKRKGKLEPKLIKRSWVTNDSMKTDQPVTEKNQSNISQAVLPSQQTMVPQAKEDCSLISTRLETEGVPRMPKLEDKTKDESSEMSQSDMEPIHSELAPMILPSPWQSKIHEVDNVPNETATKLLSEDFAIKEDMNSRSKDKESSGSVDLNEAEEEREGVSHMVLADVFVPVSEEMGEDLSEDWQLPFVSSPTREEVEKAKDLSTAFAETMKQNYSSSKESKALARRTGKQRVKRASAKNYPSKTAENITEQSQPMSQAVSATSHPTVVPHSNKDSHDPSTKLKKTDILYVPKVEPGSIAKQRSNLADGEEELRRKHAIMPCTVRLSKCLDAQLQEQRPQKAKDDLEKGSNESLNKVQTATTSYSPKVELSLEGKGDSVVTSHKGVCSQGYPEAKLSAKTICTDSLFVDFEETGPEKNCVAHMVSEELRENKLKKAAISSPVQTASEDSRERSIIEEGILKEPPVLVGKNSPAKVKANLKLPFAKRLDKKNESSNTNPPFLENRDLNPTRTVSRMRQLPITVWAKKMSIQPAAELKAEDLSKMSKMKSNFKVKESLPLFSNKSEGVEVGHQSTNLTSCSKVQPRDLKETEQAHERVSLITEMETTGDIPTMSEINKESSEGPSGSHVKTLPARRRAKIRVKPTLFKRTCTKDEDTSSKTGQTLSTQFTSRPQHDQAAKIKEESEQTTNQHTRHLSDISQIEKINSEPMESSSLLSDSWLPKSPALSPRVVLSRVAVQIGETGSSSCTPASSPVKVSTSTYQPMTPPQWMPSCVGPPLQSNSPTSPVPSENTEDEPARVSQFFIHDIFTEIVDAD
ncbi:uncharacterized protein LOC113586240 [Electrophorus electricus]|uniref:uncharacterized protein LOC113586240 n=1 Tax=Electrophorus electricus TaxID=8005 RepID=UPI0015CFE63B|nr:uncharacterized protein LOC113586240 [Electrophorus electricus]